MWKHRENGGNLKRKWKCLEGKGEGGEKRLRDKRRWKGRDEAKGAEEVREFKEKEEGSTGGHGLHSIHF